MKENSVDFSVEQNKFFQIFYIIFVKKLLYVNKKNMSTSQAFSNSVSVAETFRPELEEIKKKGAALNLKGEQRDFYLSIVSRIENNCQVLESLRNEHTSLRKQLNGLVEQKGNLSKTCDLEKDIKHWNHEVAYLKKQIDKTKNKRDNAVRRQQELEIILANFKSAEVADHPEIEATCQLKNKLDKASIKLAETNHLLKIYQSIQNQFDREKMRWTPIAEQEDKAIAQKTKDISELRIIARESTHSRDMAQSEYKKTNAQVSADKTRRDKQLEEKQEQMRSIAIRMPVSNDNENKPRQSLMSQPSAMMRSRTTKLQKEKREENLRNATTTLDKIREVFGTTDPEKIKQFFTERENNRNSLNKQIEDLKAACSKLELEQEHLKTELEELEYVSSKGVGTSRIKNEGERILKEKRQQLAIDNRKAEAFQDLQKNTFRGILHLVEMLQLINGNNEEVPTDIVETLKWIKGKIEYAKSLKENEDVNYDDFINKPLLAQIQLNKASNSEFQKIESNHKIAKRTTMLEPLRKGPKDPKNEVQQRVFGREAVKMQARLAVEAKVKKPVLNK